MKKVLLILLTTIILSGCQFVEDLAQDIKESYNNVVEEGTQVIETVKEKKAAAEETIDNLQEAAQKVKAAADAITSIGE
ncbi:lipoprotein [Candidatus Gracilibacteria bacterium]|nr:lipoprotein [Candidatus Gracilibacteria bacterium]